MLLLDDLLLLLQRQDERLLLKLHSRTLTPTPDGKTMLRPVLRLTSAMTREVATGEAWPAWLKARLPMELRGVGGPFRELGTHSADGEAAAEAEKQEVWQARGRAVRGGAGPPAGEGRGARPGCGFP